MSRFDYCQPTPGNLEYIGILRVSFAELETAIEAALPEPSREKALALTALEEANMWVNKVLSRKKGNYILKSLGGIHGQS